MHLSVVLFLHLLLAVLPRSQCSPSGVDCDIDVVFTWKRQPTEDEYVSISKKYCIESDGHKVSRFRETGTLEYAIHAVKLNLPWVRNIFIVTNGEHPCWLGADNPDVTVVNHRQIWPQERLELDLPSFNSVAIETHLHRIPGLSEHFIYLNDDMFVGQPLPKSYFFDELGRPLVSLTSTEGVPKKLLSDKDISRVKRPQSIIGTHGPYVARISTIAKIQSMWAQYFIETSSSRCRSKKNTQSRYKHQPKPPFWVYNWFGVTTNSSMGVVTGAKFLDYHFEPEEFFARVLKNRAEFFTLNDDFSPDPVKASSGISSLGRFLSSYYGPYPNSYHKDFRACELLVDKGLVDISRDNISIYATSPLSVHTLNENIQDTLSSYEVGHYDEYRLSNVVGIQGNGVDTLREVDNIRTTYFNAERGTHWREQCHMILKHPSLNDSSIIFFNELDIGMARSGNQNTALEMAKCLRMNYAYGIEFVELTLGQRKEIKIIPKGAANSRSFHGNAIFSKFPMRNIEVHQLAGTAEYWRQGGKHKELRLGERMAIFASIPVQKSATSGNVFWIDLVSTHLDAFVGENYNIKSVKTINEVLKRRNCDGVILSGDLGNRGTSLAKSASWLHNSAEFLDPILSNTMQRGHPERNPKGDWILFRGGPSLKFQPIPESIQVISASGISDHNFVTVRVDMSPNISPFRRRLHDRLENICREISFADNIKFYQNLTGNGGHKYEVNHADIIASGRLPLTKFSTRPDDLKLRTAVSQEYHDMISNTPVAPSASVVVLIGDKRRQVWSNTNIAKLAQCNGVSNVVLNYYGKEVNTFRRELDILLVNYTLSSQHKFDIYHTSYGLGHRFHVFEEHGYSAAHSPLVVIMDDDMMVECSPLENILETISSRSKSNLKLSGKLLSLGKTRKALYMKNGDIRYSFEPGQVALTTGVLLHLELLKFIEEVIPAEILNALDEIKNCEDIMLNYASAILNNNVARSSKISPSLRNIRALKGEGLSTSQNSGFRRAGCVYWLDKVFRHFETKLE